MDQLRAVSDDWLREKAGGEKGFSLGFFDPDYVRRFPVAVVERQGRIEAFANLWPGPGKLELSVDLMRYRKDAPKGVMEALFVHLMRWGKEQGYDWFELGMAPLSGFESVAGRAAVDAARAASSTSTARPSTTSRACARTRRSSTRSGSLATSPIPAASLCHASWPTSRRSSPAATGGSSCDEAGTHGGRRRAGARRAAPPSGRALEEPSGPSWPSPPRGMLPASGASHENPPRSRSR